MSGDRSRGQSVFSFLVGKKKSGGLPSPGRAKHVDRTKDSSTEVPECSSPSSCSSSKRMRIESLLNSSQLDLESLRKSCWSGIPDDLRHSCWRILLGYVPVIQSSRSLVLERKRKEYFDLVSSYFECDTKTRSQEDNAMFRQICLDVPRTSPDIPLFQNSRIMRSLERVLYVWALRHPSSGYVQGLNDLATPFFVVFLGGETGLSTNEIIVNMKGNEEEVRFERDDGSVIEVSDEVLRVIEADSFWCFSKFLDGILDHYTFAQPGIQRMVHKMQGLVRRIDEGLFTHLSDSEIQFLQFGFRWMNCLLMREFPFQLSVRLWDTYLAEGTHYATLHVYVCAALLIHFSDTLRKKDFMELVMFLQHLPTEKWEDEDMGMLLSQAYVWKTMFEDSPSHLVTT